MSRARLVVSLTSSSLVLGLGLGCGSSQAERICSMATPEQGLAEWGKRAHMAVDDPRLRPTLERVANAELVDRASIEAELSQALGQPWTCPALDALN